MSVSSTPTTGPAMGGSVHEVRGSFSTEADLEDAIARLSRAGFDRADLSLPTAHLPRRRMTPEQGATDPDIDDDKRQIRTLQTSLAGSVGAVAAAGAVIATGGAALPAVVAAAAVGIGAGGLANAASTAGSDHQSDERKEAARRGELILSVRVNDAATESHATSELRAAGARQVSPVTR